MDAGLDITQTLPVELLQKIIWVLKFLEPPTFPGTTVGKHEFKSPWCWPVHTESDTVTYVHRQGHFLGWIRLSHVNLRWRQAALSDKRLWAFASEAAILPNSWSPIFIERSGTLPLLVHLSSVKHDGGMTRRLPLADVVGPWLTPAVQARMRSLTMRAVITRDTSQEDELLSNIVAGIARHSPLLESLTLQAESPRYHRVLPLEALRGAINLQRLSLSQFILPQWDTIPFSQITHLRLEINPQTIIPDELRLSTADLHKLLSSLENIQFLELLGILPLSPLVSPVRLAPSCRHVELGVNGPIMRTCSALLSSLIFPIQASTSLILDRSYGIFGLGSTAIPSLLDQLFGQANAPTITKLSITNTVVEVAAYRDAKIFSRPSCIFTTPLSPHLSAKLVEPHAFSSADLIAALKRACISSAQVLHLECDQVATSMQMLQRLFDDPAATYNSVSSTNTMITLSINMHKELYLRKSPLWNIFDALAEKRGDDKPAFPALQTLVVSGLPHYTHWSTLAIPPENIHYLPATLIACLKRRRELGYPMASLQIPLSCRSAAVEDGLEGLVYLEYF
ncbi:hypothetical protein PENSPDRAFT_656960 [Peniophora sp. CONT]|nr:hypothetical protein PENSPDRAFT_656960 [Peniophora sp. CONT]